MTLLQALSYFFREAAVSLRRSWKVSSLAVVTIAVSLFVGGAFLLAGAALADQVERWRGEAKMVVYLAADAQPETAEAIAATARAAPWAAAVEEIGPEQAAARFRRTFPSLADLVAGDDGDTPPPLPASVEVTPRADADRSALDAWAAEMRRRPGVDAVDDDRDWLAQLDAAAAVVRATGLTLGAVLLGAAVFTIASVIRLTAYLYQEEIAVMRLVGATEFFIRGPFYVEGFLQGLIGGSLAAAALAAGWRLLLPDGGPGLLGRMLTAAAPGWREAVALIALGALAGLAGALLSLRREDLGRAPATEG